MSAFGDYKKPEIKLTKRQAFEVSLAAPFELSFSIGSTFSLLPDFYLDRWDILEMDWLWFHCGIYRKNRF